MMQKVAMILLSAMLSGLCWATLSIFGNKERITLLEYQERTALELIKDIQSDVKFLRYEKK